MWNGVGEDLGPCVPCPGNKLEWESTFGFVCEMEMVFFGDCDHRLTE